MAAIRGTLIMEVLKDPAYLMQKWVSDMRLAGVTISSVKIKVNEKSFEFMLSERECDARLRLEYGNEDKITGAFGKCIAEIEVEDGS